jgi:DNA invertase Pin-like site-specific DNA recombinase
MTSPLAQVLVAQYLRVSTDNQRYSLERQSECIGDYAAERGFSIIQTYVDRAKSGLLLKNRPGLKQLLADVTGGRITYRAVLVYDVSRWGRFQDVDEAGHYEFICKQSGVPVHYCAEVFENDDTPISFIMKAVKRMMAGEYSRELGIRCFAGQKRVAQLGFRAGGAAGYGCRRILVNADRSVKQQLGLNDRKSLATDRVILAPGPENEVACVRQIYRMLIDKNMSFCAIARELNRQCVPCIGSMPWTHFRVRAILTNPKYNGTVVYGRLSRRLQTPQVKMPPDNWVVVPHAFESVVDDATYSAAQQTLAGRTTHKPNSQLLDELRSILSTHGRLTAQLIRSTKGATPPRSYRQRFGGLCMAYELIGYRTPILRNIEKRHQVYQARVRLMKELEELFAGKISIEGRRGPSHKWLRLKRTRIAVRVCSSFKTLLGGLRWRIRSDPAETRVIVLLGLMNPGNDAIGELVLLPPMSLPRTIDVSANSTLLKIGRPIPNLHAFFEVVSEMKRGRQKMTKFTVKCLRATIPAHHN